MTGTGPGAATNADRVWLITGCSSGIGRELALAALAKGERVAVTARDVTKVHDIVASAPGRALALALDVTKPEQVGSAVGEAERMLGCIDVLVNNAGYGYLAAIEEGDEADVRALFETNYFGMVAMIRAVLPGMRARGRGHIINVSSMTGLVGNPGVGYYASTKWAMEGFSEALRKELAPLGIRVSLVEPGAIRTEWAGGSLKQSPASLAAYALTVGARRTMIRGAHGTQAGDPRRVAEAIVMLSALEDPPMRLLLGRDVFEMFSAKLDEMKASLEQWRAVSLDVDYR
ncbi:MAG: SDR family NAD(P)-dependent oxidoreductase [Gammaproteobacteria bacterium]|nr:SDR family NAD(P)-dependent oxidoreductase [Gammaproteobacteria bacterium]